MRGLLTAFLLFSFLVPHSSFLDFFSLLEINAQKRSAYEKRRERESSAAEEIDV